MSIWAFYGGFGTFVCDNTKSSEDVVEIKLNSSQKDLNAHESVHLPSLHVKAGHKSIQCQLITAMLIRPILTAKVHLLFASC